MSDTCNTTWTSSMGKDNDKRNRRNRENAKQNTQTVTASPNITINCRSSNGDKEKEYLQYSTMMLYHSIMNSEEERIAKNIVKEQHKYDFSKLFRAEFNQSAKRQE